MEEYNKLLKQQDNSCAICQEKFGNKRIYNHSRTLLCSCCNTGLGMFHYDSGLLLKAIAYINKYKQIP